MINNENDINLRKIKIKTFLIQEFWEEIKLCNPEKKNQQLMFAIVMSAYPSEMSAYPSVMSAYPSVMSAYPSEAKK